MKLGRVVRATGDDQLKLASAGVSRDAQLKPLPGEVKVWDASTGDQLLAPLRLGASPVETGLWSLDGRFIVARSDDNVVRVWDSAVQAACMPPVR